MIATAIGGLSLPIGCIIGFAVPSFMMNDEDAENPEQGRADFYKYLLVQNIIVTLLSLPLAFLARERPLTPPS